MFPTVTADALMTVKVSRFGEVYGHMQEFVRTTFQSPEKSTPIIEFLYSATDLSDERRGLQLPCSEHGGLKPGITIGGF